MALLSPLLSKSLSISTGSSGFLVSLPHENAADFIS